jgi:hypothetical protein
LIELKTFYFSQAVRDLLGIPVSSKEKLFNTENDIIGVRRDSLQANSIKILVSLKDLFV